MNATLVAPFVFDCETHPSLQPFFDLATDLLSVRGSDGYFQELNRAWTETLGWSLEELKSRPYLDFIHPDDIITTCEMEAPITQGFSPIEYKNRFCCQDGSYRWLSWRLSPVKDGRIYGIARDVTQASWWGSETYRTQIQEAIKLRDRAIEASSVGVVIADARLPDRPIIYVNPAFETITGYTAAEVLGINCRFLQGKDRQQPAVQQLREAIKAGRDCTVILLNYRKDGNPFWNELTISPIYDEQDQLTHFVGIQSDVSDRVAAEKALHQEQLKSERLLLNILPKPIADQLKQFQGTLAEQFSSVSILFADLVGFTSFASEMPPLELVNLLNQIFSTFDRLAEKYGVEKIKTIGDAYMAAAGLPIPRTDHAQAIASMALEMQEAIVQFQTPTPLQLRIGINTGSVVAGVIGIQKFIYDLWGDTVNVASRMESTGEPGQIQVTQATYEHLKEQFTFTPREAITVKGKGKMSTYWLTGKKRIKT